MDINFLPDEEKKDKSSQNQKEKKEIKRKVSWSQPEKGKTLSGKLSGIVKKGIKSYLPDFFNTNFLRKKKEKAKEVYPNNLADKNKLRQSRRELLKLIGEEEKAVEVPPTAGKAEETKVSPAKKKRPEIRLEITRLFKSVAAIFKKIGKKPKTDGGQEEKGKEQERKPLLENKKEANHRPGHRQSGAGGAGGTGKEIVPDFIQAEDKKEGSGGETLETNLIKGEITVFFDWRKNAAVFLIGIILAALAVGAAYGLISWHGSQKEKASQYFVDRFSELDKEIARIEGEAKKVLVFKKKLSLVNSLLDQHVYWTNFFKFLEENTLADVYYSGFLGDNKGKYNLTAKAKEFSLIQAQVERFLSSEYVSSVSVDQAGISAAENKKASTAGEIAFGLKLVIDPAIFTSVK